MYAGLITVRPSYRATIPPEGIDRDPLRVRLSRLDNHHANSFAVRTWTIYRGRAHRARRGSTMTKVARRVAGRLLRVVPVIGNTERALPIVRNDEYDAVCPRRRTIAHDLPVERLVKGRVQGAGVELTDVSTEDFAGRGDEDGRRKTEETVLDGERSTGV